MKSKRTAGIKITVCAALCAAFGTAQAVDAEVVSADECRKAVGFPVFSGSTDSSTETGAWAVVTANADAFQARNIVYSCRVDYKVQPSGKGKPNVMYYPVAVNSETGMVKDLCTTYGELGAIDSDIYLVKFQEAFNKASALAEKLLKLRDTDKLTYGGYNALATSGTGVDSVVDCLYKLTNQ